MVFGTCLHLNTGTDCPLWENGMWMSKALAWKSKFSLQPSFFERSDDFNAKDAHKSLPIIG